MASTHGGAQFELIGHNLANGHLRSGIVPADVLDAWFDPAPGVIKVLKDEVAWMCRTSPPADTYGLESEIASVFDLDPESVVVGAGSSDLVYRFLTENLDATSRVFILDPTYSEYRHICKEIIGCRVESAASFAGLHGLHDLIVVVNPNNPTGELFSSEQLLDLAEHLTSKGRVWVDEAYLPYVQDATSLRSRASCDAKFIVCQSLSKALALSGLRLAFLVCKPHEARAIRRRRPPWHVSMPAVLACHAALQEPDYYRSRYAETAMLKSQLYSELCRHGIETSMGAANWITVRTQYASCALRFCRSSGVLLRGGEGMFLDPPAGFVRIAVRSREENRVVSETLRMFLNVQGARCARL